MNIPNVLLAVMAILVSATAFAILLGDYRPVLRDLAIKARPLTQTGDTSLSRRSVNWLAGMALGVALLICFGLM